MKIRTGFVTNSSSHSSAVVRIQSKQLADLLKEYQDLFPDLESDFAQGGCISMDVAVFADDWAPPKRLEDLIERLLNGLRGESSLFPADQDAFERLRGQMQDQTERLTDSIERVEWEFRDEAWWEFQDENDEQEWEDAVKVKTFAYDRAAGGSGAYEERVEYDEKQDDEDESCDIGS